MNVMKLIKEARARAKRRKNAWNLLLIPVIVFLLGAIWISGMFAAESLHMAQHPGQTLKNGIGAGVVMATMGPIIGAVPLAMLIGNLLVALIPPARRALEAESESVPGTNLASAQMRLLKLLALLLPVSVVITGLGAWLSWV
ncbi:MAG: hypothetical protein OEZ10_11440 [Gammaproteobacteria bacterium]|nr:hypothetical protein [Gammaproteobacteria bacterium]